MDTEVRRAIKLFERRRMQAASVAAAAKERGARELELHSSRRRRRLSGRSHSGRRRMEAAERLEEEWLARVEAEQPEEQEAEWRRAQVEVEKAERLAREEALLLRRRHEEAAAVANLEKDRARGAARQGT